MPYISTLLTMESSLLKAALKSNRTAKVSTFGIGLNKQLILPDTLH